MEMVYRILNLKKLLINRQARNKDINFNNGKAEATTDLSIRGYRE